METPHPTVETMWKDYLETVDNTVDNAVDKASMTCYSWYFCNNRKDADELAELVVQGIKRATTSALPVYEYEQEPLPKVGDLSIITNWNGEARCIIRTTKITVVPFEEVTPGFAATEGEGDKSLAYWRKAHHYFFTKELNEIGLTFTESTRVICEEFELVFPLDD